MFKRKIQKEIWIILLAALVVTSCQNREDPGRSKSSMANRPVKEVMEDHAGKLISIPEVTAVAVSELEDGTPCIKILIIEESAEIRAELPDSLEGYPVVVEVSGRIEAKEAKSE